MRERITILEQPVKKMFSLLLTGFLTGLLGLLCIVCLAACKEERTLPETEASAHLEAIEEEERGGKEQTWAIYWYLCGSDLETYYGAATRDLEEMLAAKLSENVQVVVQTGGAAAWQNELVEADAIERYVYSSKGLAFIEQKPLTSMGDPHTFAEFLAFCSKNHPADRTMVLVWNHGGGSIYGAAFDENYGYDSLTLDEFYEAFGMVYELSTQDPPIDVLGFDACLMATVDAAYTFCDVADYLVASQEMEPGNGWYYTGWLQALSEEPTMGGARLGRLICDSYAEGCKINQTQEEITLSVTDLGRIGNLIKAYDRMGKEALRMALEAPVFFNLFSRKAERCESYGGNTKEDGYTNMVDLGHLARSSLDLLGETAQAVLNGLEECVVYRINGPYRREATGLSCYYSFNSDLKDLSAYTKIGCSEGFGYFYTYGLGGEFSKEGMNYVNSLGYAKEELPTVPTLSSQKIQKMQSIYIDEEGYAVMDLGTKSANLLKGVYFQLAYVNEKEGIILWLGRDNDLKADWENGRFKDNFRGVWGTIDGHLVYMEIVYEGEDYHIYTIPILLNGEEYNLRVTYDYQDEQYHILGARKKLGDSGMADKNLIRLTPGDEITTILYAASSAGDNHFEAFSSDTFTVTKDTAFYEMAMGDGQFMLMFELVDSQNKTAWSEPVLFAINGEDIRTIVYE